MTGTADTARTAPDESTERWAQRLLDGLENLSRSAQQSALRLPAEETADLSAMLGAGRKLAETMSSSTVERKHDMLNLIGAIRGYAEMLDEASDQLEPPLRSALATVLQLAMSPAQPPTSGRSSQPGAAERIAAGATEPGVILAVDDMPENRDLVSRLLARSGHTVVTAESGEEALELLATLAVDVVLLDLMMPGIGGAEVLRHMKEDERLRATPVVMISGRQDMDQIVACIQAGADDYLLKPFNPVLLQARIAAGIERKRWHDREEQYREQLERNERFIRSTFGRYLSNDIVDELLENPEGLNLGGDLRTVTIMMSDIRGFTTLSEQLSPQRVMQLLNRYLGRMTEIIIEHGGTIDEFLGDAVLAVFGAPKSAADDADRALQCALAMQNAMAAVNVANQEDGLPELSMAIALNTGPVVAGNIGSARRAKYGFVGHSMNVTSRIEDHAQRDEILAAKSTIDAAHRRFITGEARTLTVKGIEGKVMVMPILGTQ